MIYGLGPRAQRVYISIRDRISRGDLPPGTKLPSHTHLAAEFGVAPLTIRQVLARLDEEGLVSREHGRGTFVRTAHPPGVLILEDDAEMRALLRAHVQDGGYRAVTAETPAEALTMLDADGGIALILSDIRLPDKADGITFIRAARRRWPGVPLAAITGYPDDLAELHGTPEFPVLVLPKPVWAHQIAETLALAIRRA